MSSRVEELQELLQYMAPGSTVDDIVGESDSGDEASTYDVVQGKHAATSRVVLGAAPGANAQREATSLSKMQPAQHTTTHASVLRRIRVDDFYVDASSFSGGAGGANVANQRVLNDLREMTMSNRLMTAQSSKDVDRSERATVENVMDPRTRLILYKLVNGGHLKEINGCVSTGKEANVYYAVAGDGSDAAVKVFKTSILVFKDREKYVAGEFRFQRYCKSNPRKMVRTWAEKEARNLNRLQDGGVLAPAVKLLRQHVLIMEFLGEDGWPAPRLKEVRFPSAGALDRCYLDICCTLRKMYGRCRLIHGDLSEYNLLFYRGRVVVIDVSQSVENDHPHAMDFLRRDIVNVNTFFRSKGHQQLFSPQDLYRFITAAPAPNGWQRCDGPDNVEEIRQHLLELREQRGREDGVASVNAEQAKVDEQVFLNIAVPRTLGDVADHKAVNAELAPFVAELTASPATRPHLPAQGASDVEEEEESESDASGRDEVGVGGSHSSGSSSSGSGGDAGEEGAKKASLRPPPRTIAGMTKEERREYHKSVKEANRERRASKKKNKNAKKKKKQ
ncbi:RIO kinase 1 [Trypanosoma rangeli]|uniref:Serine/threonine-protein kinase RIO1 n=1 Tax=Trypanosoma rangeli TaxID=5698 RepID=A0A422NUW2_TRYRA|nr:RIO kinase 1 [Trypanosoma rangeli]RNF09234.1 RIO kinase 1 [Trypanosoma rangeli]|eukprot:RNF09234.1 RIO kinase 1 [Trypanosoma rangeli]